MEKQTQVMVVLQNIVSTVMLKNYKLSNGNVRLHLTTPVGPSRSVLDYALHSLENKIYGCSVKNCISPNDRKAKREFLNVHFIYSVISRTLPINKPCT